MKELPVPVVINNSLTDIGNMIARLGKIQYAIHSADNEMLSVCLIKTSNNLDVVTRLLDPHLDDVCDNAISGAIKGALRKEASKIIDDLAKLGIQLDDSVTESLLEEQL